MIVKFSPETDKVYTIDRNTLFHVLEGSGSIQVDFKNYTDWQDKLIYLEKGQYIKFLSANFVIRKIEFEDDRLFHDKEVRVLFKHLVSLGYINFKECEDCKRYLSDTVFNSENSNIIDISSKQWFWQNPFQANKEEYHIIFDIKEVIDKEFQNHLTQKDVVDLINTHEYSAQELVKNKVGLSIKSLLSNKLMLESKKELAFTQKNVKEVSFDMGFKDPSYFNRAFKKFTGQNPNEFKELFGQQRDLFVQDLLGMIKKYHEDEQALNFYADKMHMSVKGLSNKVRAKMNISLGQLIRQEMILTAQKMLAESESIVEVSHKLRFEEPNHFSSFFKRYTGLTPTEYKQSLTS